MITRTDFAAIESEVKNALDSTLQHIQATYPDNYVLFLAEGEYQPAYASDGYSPYVIDNRTDRYKDDTRLKFFTQFLQTFYDFRNGAKQTDDNEQRMHMELMVYCHVWEATPFLKKLFRLTSVFIGKSFPWQVDVPLMGKHKFIREEIRDVFKNQGHPMQQIMTNGFHSQIRNAFAHSEYSFDDNGKRIWFDNYDENDNYTSENISYDDWSKRFAYSVWLAYYLVWISHERRTRLIDDFGTDTFTIDYPSKTGAIKKVNIIYRSEHDGFSFAR